MSFSFTGAAWRRFDAEARPECWVLPLSVLVCLPVPAYCPEIRRLLHMPLLVE